MYTLLHIFGNIYIVVLKFGDYFDPSCFGIYMSMHINNNQVLGPGGKIL